MTVWQTVHYALLPAICLLVGGFIGLFWLPKPKITSAIQHFAAGVVFAAVALELLPKIAHTNATWSVVIGFALGVLVMLALKYFSEKLEHSGSKGQMPLGLLSAVGVDVFIDGILIGVAFLAGEQGGILITFALAIEVFFLGLSTAATLGQKKISRVVSFFYSLFFAVILPIGTLLGAAFLAQLPSTWLTEVLAFGVAALLYLVTEELLVEAHEVEEKPWITAMFFLGFLVILLLEI